MKLYSESIEERQSRLTKCREYVSAHRKNESSEQREKRLAYARGKHMSFEDNLNVKNTVNMSELVEKMSPQSKGIKD